MVPAATLALVVTGGYLAWHPGVEILDGRHDLQANGIWVQHGWLGADEWFARNGKDAGRFRDPEKVEALATLLTAHGIQYVFPHLCPCRPDGRLPDVDSAQTERFLDQFANARVLPWIGGVLNDHCSLESPQWRQTFIASTVELLASHPRLAGVHINIEPLPSGSPAFLLLLDEFRTHLPNGAILSVAAYPPPTVWHRYPNVHWEEAYFRQVARRTNLLAVMMYDTSLRWSKPYQALMRDWTIEVLNWAGNCPVLLGIPAYDDADSGYHDPTVENLQNSITGIHAGLRTFKTLPANYRGVCIYSDWEMNGDEWHQFDESFGARGNERSSSANHQDRSGDAHPGIMPSHSNPS